MSNEQLTSNQRADLAAALERDLRQLGLDDGAAFIRAQQAEIERLLIHWLCQCGTANPITEQACASCGAGKPPDEPVAQLSNERCEHSPLYTYDSVGIQYRAPCPWCLQLELTRIVAEGAAHEPVAPSSPPADPSAWIRGRVTPPGPHGPEEYDEEVCPGEDQPPGEGWVALYTYPHPYEKLRASAPPPTARRIELLNLLEDRERKHDAFRLAEQGGQYAVELTAFDRAHAEVIDWVTDHADELLPLLRAVLPPSPPRCSLTGNPCGTDTWAVHAPPDCQCGRMYRAGKEHAKASQPPYIALLNLKCRFGCTDPAVVLVEFDDGGCVCWPDTVQALCAQHWQTSEPIKGARAIALLAEPPTAVRLECALEGIVKLDIGRHSLTIAKDIARCALAGHRAEVTKSAAPCTCADTNNGNCIADILNLDAFYCVRAATETNDAPCQKQSLDAIRAADQTEGAQS